MYKELPSGDYYFTQQHEWLRVEGDTAFIGLTTLAKKELGEIKSIEVHTLQKNLNENQVFGRIRTQRYLCKLIMPLRGTVIEANTINYTSFNQWDKDFNPDEWIVKIKLQHPLNPGHFYTWDEYKSSQAEDAPHLVKYFLKVGERSR